MLSVQKRRALLITSCLALLFSLAAVLLGSSSLGNQNYYLISLLVLCAALIPFFVLFERRKPRARELVTLSVLCAIAIAGRAAFYLLPQVKPVAAIVIISAVCLGPQAGFLVGAVSSFVSNFFFGQGPNTPWQMTAFGLLGFLAGILCQCGILKKKRIPLCIYGALSTLVLYGGLVNFGTMLIAGLPPTLPSFLTVCITGLPFDLIHAASTVLFLFLLSRPMIEKIDRIRIKYGLMEENP